MQFHTIYIYYIQPIIVLPLENIITSLFIYSCRDQVLLLLSFWYILRFVSLMLGLSNALSLLLYSVKLYILYLADTLPPIFGCLNVYFCYFVILNIDYNITLLTSN